MESQSEVQSSHNSSETTNVAVSRWDDLTDGQKLCLHWTGEQDWDRIKGYAKEHGPEVLLGVYTVLVGEKWGVASILNFASQYDNVAMVKFTLEAGFDNKEAMYTAADVSIKNSDNSTILRLLLEHGLDPNMDLRVEGMDEGIYNLLVSATTVGQIDHAIALLDHGANVNKTVVDRNGDVFSPLTWTLDFGEHDICRLFLTRGAITTTNDVLHVFRHCLAACKGEHPRLSRDVAIKMFATFLHLGKPDSDVVREKIDSCHPSYSDPTITNITKHYLQGRPFCCFVCEALTAKERDKLLFCPCRNVTYCSRSCQVKHWREHKVQCTGPLNEERGESEAMVKKRSKTEKVEEREEERAFSESDVGRRVRVIWGVDEAYEGNVDMFNHENGQAHVLYDDGDEEWLNPEDPDTKYEFLSEKTGKGMKGGGADVGVAAGAVATGKNGKKGKKGKENLDPESLRFRVGDKVQCRIGSDPATGWGNGTVTQLFYRKNKWPLGQVAPYKISLEDGTNIFAPQDIQDVIRKPNS
jgi:hypothetical protein